MKVVLDNVTADLTKEQAKEIALRLVRDHYKIPPNVYFSEDQAFIRMEPYKGSPAQSRGLTALQILQDLPV